MLEIVGADERYEKRIRDALALYPEWYVAAAGISKVLVTNREDVKKQIAVYEHGSRVLNIAPGMGEMIVKAVGHELAHGVDDIFDEPHHFSSSATWQMIHRNQAYFDIPKYMDQPLEYFADMMVKFFLMGPEKLRTTNPAETNYITGAVLPVLVELFSKGT